MNYILFFCILIISICSVYFSKKMASKLGLTIVFILANLLSLILSFKYVMLSTINVNANSITYITAFTALFLLIESINKEEVKKIINLNFIITIFSSFLLYIMSYYVQSLTDTISINMSNVFINNYRILITYPLTILLSNYILIWMYKRIRKLYDIPFITTVTTYLAIGLIEAIIYFFAVYYNTLDIKIIIKLLLSSYMVRLIITIIYSIFLTLITSKKVKK